MLKAENGATMETDLEETPRGWVARYLIVSRTSGSSSRSGRSLRARPMPSPGSRRRLPLMASSTRPELSQLRS
jgi:hypothetical protein